MSYTSSYCSLPNALQDGWTSLHIASQDGHAAAIEVLLKAGANVRATDNVSYHCLAFAEAWS